MAAGDVRFNIRGLKETVKQMKDLEPKVAKKVIRQSIRAGLKIVAAAAKAQTQFFGGLSTGKTRDAIKVKAVRKRKKNTIRMQVMVGAGDYKGETFYASFPEYGTVKQKAQRFMARAFDKSKDQASKLMIDQLQAGIRREWEKR